MLRTSGHAAVLLLTILARSPLAAQVEEGKVAKYHDFDPEKGVPEGAFPELTLDDLRKITLYSRLMIAGSRVLVADDRHMRKVEAHPADRDVLVVTSDHFRFTTLKNGIIPPKELGKDDQGRCRFVWVKHATRETAPDGKPWLKDLILLPYDRKTGKLIGAWPFSVPERPESRAEELLFILRADPRPRLGDFPPPEKCVAGRFHSGNVDYLVLDVFGAYGWWGKIGWLEFFTLRGKPQAAIDTFHGGAGRWIHRPFQSGKSRAAYTVLVTDGSLLNQTTKDLAELAELPVEIGGVPAPGWEDLLRLEEENRPVESIDRMIGKLRTFGELIDWSQEYYRQHMEGAYFTDWYQPLEEKLEERGGSYVTSVRVLRYAFRRVGFPARVLCIPEKDAAYPRLLLHVHVPSRGLSLILPHRPMPVFRSESSVPWSLPLDANTRGGKVPGFDAELGGGDPLLPPDPAARPLRFRFR